MNILYKILFLLGFDEENKPNGELLFNLDLETGEEESITACFEEDIEGNDRLIFINEYEDRLQLDQFLIQYEDQLIERWEQNLSEQGEG